MKNKHLFRIAGIMLASHLLLSACSQQEGQSSGPSSVEPKAVKVTKASSSKDKEKQLVVVSEIMEDSYVKVHGDHFHMEEGFVPYHAKFIEETVAPDDYKLNKDDILYDVAHGWIVKIDDACYYLPDGEEGKAAIMTLEEAQKKTANLEMEEDGHGHHHHHHHHHGHDHDHHDHKHDHGKAKKKPSQASKDKQKAKKEVAGVTKKTDDGFILTNENQISQKTAKGIIVDHNGHSHFIFYKDLEGSRWSYLIPSAKESKALAKAPVQLHASSNHGGSKAGTLDDGYVFNPADIVSEDAYGYTVRHGDHFHYIPKSSVGGGKAQTKVAAGPVQSGQRVSAPVHNTQVNTPQTPQKGKGSSVPRTPSAQVNHVQHKSEGTSHPTSSAKQKPASPTQPYTPSHSSSNKGDSPRQSEKDDLVANSEMPQVSMDKATKPSTEDMPKTSNEKVSAEKTAGSPGIDYPTDDGFLFDGTGVLGRIPFGLLVDHHGHTHVLPEEQVKNSKWAHLLEEYPLPGQDGDHPLAPKERHQEVEEQEVAPTVENEQTSAQPLVEEDYSRQLTYVANERHLDPSLLEIVDTDKGKAIRYPHKDHHHTVLIADIPDKDNTLEAKLDYLAKLHHVDMSSLQLTETGLGQAVLYPHGDHFHTVLLSEVDPQLDPEDKDARNRIGMNTLKALGFDDEVIEDLLHATSKEPFPGKERDPEKMKEWLKTVTAINVGQRVNPLTRPGLELLENLEVLGAGFTPISDISPVYQFKNLKQLWISRTGIKDYQFLDHLPNLEGIDLSENEVSDLSFLAKYPNLRVVSAAANGVKDISALAKLPALTSLNLDYNGLTDINPLRQLQNLKAISLEHNDVKDLSALKSPALERLYVSHNPNVDWTTLASANLQELQAVNANVKDLGFLKENPKLSEVNVASNQVKDLSGLEEAKNLEKLTVSDNQLAELGLEKEQDSLKQLDASQNQLTSLEGVQHLTALEELDVHQNNLEDLTLSQPAKSVEIIDASENKLKEEDLKPRDNGVPEAVAENFPNVYAGSVADQKTEVVPAASEESGDVAGQE